LPSRLVRRSEGLKPGSLLRRCSGRFVTSAPGVQGPGASYPDGVVSASSESVSLLVVRVAVLPVAAAVELAPSLALPLLLFFASACVALSFPSLPPVALSRFELRPVCCLQACAQSC
jgi:hypothetical protein